MTFPKFLAHYANEAMSVASALRTVLDSIAPGIAGSANVLATINALEDAATNIVLSLKDEVKEHTVKISKKDIETAVAAMLPDMLEDIVTKAVISALALKGVDDVVGDTNGSGA